jgi:hypothetical protein
MPSSDTQFKKGERRSPATEFTADRLKGNQWAKGNPPNKTSFNSSVFGENHPSWKGGIHKPKNDCLIKNIGPNKRVRLNKYNWELAYGPLPKGYILYHLDRDPHNCDVDNLEAITRAELLARNIHRIPS